MERTLSCMTVELIERLGRLTRNLQFAGGLNPAQWEALRFLSRVNQASRTPSALADYLGSTKGTASQTLLALEDKGYIRRWRDKKDRRVAHLEITAPGETLLAEDPLRRVEQVVAELSESECRAMVTSLEALLLEMHRALNMRVFGVCGRCGHLRSDDPAAPVPRCGLTGAALNREETDKLCANFGVPGPTAESATES